VLYNETLLAKNAQCAFALMQLVYDEDTQIFSNLPGIQVSVRDFGRFDGIEAVYWSFPVQLEKWGYKIGQNAFGAPYDYRFMSEGSLERSGFVEELIELVGTAFEKNGMSKVVLSGHSNGGPTLYTFLQQMSSDWKDKYVSALVGLSGNYLGQMNGVKSFITTQNAEHDMQNSWEGMFMSMPFGDYEQVSNIPIVMTFFAEPKFVGELHVEA